MTRADSAFVIGVLSVGPSSKLMSASILKALPGLRIP
eukprot:CAMPEP_0198225306 /NCGR_PEP_ID=MMETSP1445-20131203/100624_1 /TAXON_ID=36898 /ORGANISM="Pyramimonas sp., Strain CCMP2087" /LENGTH=36 /DNA_ID= /DNA_START= /DNA_END= /DNA_ORIENTATION=